MIKEKIKYAVCLAMLMGQGTGVWAGDITYTRADSVKVVTLLREAAALDSTVCLPLHFAGRLKGIPYVASTLEVNPREQLVVNLRQLDCTTLVETVVALTRAAQQGQATFEAFCRQLRLVRYAGGKLDGYASRNHYFSQWIRSNERLGVVEEIKGTAADDYAPFAEKQQLDLHYMSTYPEKYPMLKGDPLMQRRVREAEQRASGTTVRYIPRRLLGRGKDVLGCVRDGDILAIVTRKKGLDTSHLGFAVWVKGRLHLLNASSIHKKVVLEPMTLYDYMTKHPSQAGVRVVRIK